MKSAKDLLSSIELNDKKEGKKKRSAKIEFQAYAYRLASDLNDLVNLQIYMRLAKNIERSLMERAYSYVSDSNSNDKGRLFLWKLKQIRREVDKSRNKENFSSDFVMKRMKIFRNLFAKEIFKKLDEDLNLKLIDLITQFLKSDKLIKKAIVKKETKKNLLFVGVPPLSLIKLANEQRYLISVVDFSLKINSILKVQLEKNSKEEVKVILKDFLKNKFKEKKFDRIIVFGYWQMTPKELEKDLIAELKRNLKLKGKILMNFKISDKSSQEWKSYKLGKEEYEFFVKYSNLEEVIVSFSEMGFEPSSQLYSNKMQFVEFSEI